jgi:hypothetical protein
MKKEILKAIENGAETARDVAAAVGCDVKGACRVLYVLHKEGNVERSRKRRDRMVVWHYSFRRTLSLEDFAEQREHYRDAISLLAEENEEARERLATAINERDEERMVKHRRAGEANRMRDKNTELIHHNRKLKAREQAALAMVEHMRRVCVALVAVAPAQAVVDGFLAEIGGETVLDDEDNVIDSWGE